MKKYVKPQLCFESFELTQHIAGDCTVIFDHAENSCTVGTLKPGHFGPGVNVFTVGSCEEGPVQDDYCYYSAAATFRGFSS